MSIIIVIKCVFSENCTHAERKKFDFFRTEGWHVVAHMTIRFSVPFILLYCIVELFFCNL